MSSFPTRRSTFHQVNYFQFCVLFSIEPEIAGELFFFFNFKLWTSREIFGKFFFPQEKKLFLGFSIRYCQLLGFRWGIFFFDMGVTCLSFCTVGFLDINFLFYSHNVFSGDFSFFFFFIRILGDVWRNSGGLIVLSLKISLSPPPLSLFNSEPYLFLNLCQRVLPFEIFARTKTANFLQFSTEFGLTFENLNFAWFPRAGRLGLSENHIFQVLELYFTGIKKFHF